MLTSRDWRTTRIPQVRTRVPDYCEAEMGTVRSAKVRPLIRAIRNVPHTVSDYYIGRYQRKIRELESLDPKPPGTDGLIRELEDKRNDVQKFKSSLPPRQ